MLLQWIRAYGIGIRGGVPGWEGNWKVGHSPALKYGTDYCGAGVIMVMGSWSNPNHSC